MAERSSGVYVIRNRVTGGVYVGSTFNLERRWNQHLGLLKRGAHSNPELQAAWNEHGSDVFSVELVESIPPDAGLLEEGERRWFERLRSEGVMLFGVWYLPRVVGPHSGPSIILRVSRSTHRILKTLAAEEGRSITELLDELAEKARRQRILDQSAARMREIMADADERRSYLDELELSEAFAAEAMRDEPPYADERCRG